MNQMKNFSSLVIVLLLTVLLGCSKDDLNTDVQTSSTITNRSAFNCYTTVDDAASIQLINPLSPKSWFNLGFCFTPPTQNITNPIVYTNNDSMDVNLQIFVNRVFMRTNWYTEKIDEYFYQPVFHPYPTPVTRFPQKTLLQNGTFTFPINFKFEKKGLYNKFINSYGYTYDTVRYNWDAYDFGMHSKTTNGYAYVRLIIKSDKP